MTILLNEDKHKSALELDIYTKRLPVLGLYPNNDEGLPSFELTLCDINDLQKALEKAKKRIIDLGLE